MRVLWSRICERRNCWIVVGVRRSRSNIAEKSIRYLLGNYTSIRARRSRRESVFRQGGLKVLFRALSV